MITLEKFEEANCELLISWVHSPEFLMQFAGPAFTFPLTREQLVKSLADLGRSAFQAINVNSGKMIGYAEINITEQGPYLGRILIDESFRGKGFGKEIVQQLLDIAFGKMKQQIVRLRVFDWNISAIKCYEGVGFTIEPNNTLLTTVNGKTWTGLVMRITKDHWEKMTSNHTAVK